MGIRRLTNFTKDYDFANCINLRREIEEWRSTHSGNRPIILIDFKSLTYSIKLPIKFDICGGRHQAVLQSWIKFLETLKTLACDFVFFADSVTPMWKSDEWMSRQDGNFKRWQELYNFIEKNKTLKNVPLKLLERLKSLNATYYEMCKKAKEYGVFHYSIKNDNDLMIAQYAKQHHVFAIISNDSDFLIYDGDWKLFSCQDVDITQLQAIEFNKEFLWSTHYLNLESHKRPLFATLAGNDHTRNNKKFELRTDKYELHRIAKYVRELRFFGRGSLQFDIEKVAKVAFGSDNKESCQLIKKSVSSYNIDRRLKTNDDTFGTKLLEHPIYQSYISLTYPVVGIPMPFYDMDGQRRNRNLPELLIGWTTNKKAVLMKMRSKKPPQTYILLAKKNYNGNFEKSTEKIIYPEFNIPAQIILGSNVVPVEIDEKRWEIFQFIMSFSAEEVITIKELEKPFRLICTILYVLVKKQLLVDIEADGILCTEWNVHNETERNVIPTEIDVELIRSAHIYVNVFPHVRENFAIAGLLSYIQDELQFDGVYYQQFMNSFVKKSVTERQEYVNKIQHLRIYA